MRSARDTTPVTFATLSGVRTTIGRAGILEVPIARGRYFGRPATTFPGAMRSSRVVPVRRTSAGAVVTWRRSAPVRRRIGPAP